MRLIRISNTEVIDVDKICAIQDCGNYYEIKMIKEYGCNPIISKYSDKNRSLEEVRDWINSLIKESEKT